MDISKAFHMFYKTQSGRIEGAERRRRFRNPGRRLRHPRETEHSCHRNDVQSAGNLVQSNCSEKEKKLSRGGGLNKISEEINQVKKLFAWYVHKK